MAHGELAGIIEARGGDVVVHVHVQPRAGTTAVAGRHGAALRLRVRAPAVDGRATEAARRLVAETLGVPAARVELEAGERSRLKRYRVRGIGLGAARAACAAAIAAAEGSRRGEA